MNTIRAVLIPASPLEPARIVEVEDSEEAMAERLGADRVGMVGTYMRDCVLVVDDEAKAKGCPISQRVSGLLTPGFVAGDVLLAARSGLELVSITDEQLHSATRHGLSEGVV